jgi:predicted Zn-ribbon and HTH transcriptional regulator
VHCSHCTKVLSSWEQQRSHEYDAHTVSTKCRDCGIEFSRDALSKHSASNECSHAFEPVRRPCRSPEID